MSNRTGIAVVVFRLPIWIVACAIAASGCAFFSPSPSSRAARLEPPGRDAPAALPLGQWNRFVLMCEGGGAPADDEIAPEPIAPDAPQGCGNWHRFSVSASGVARIVVSGPVGPDIPDFDMRLEASDGDVLWGYGPTGYSPREIERVLEPGDYYLLVETIGERRGSIAYDVYARIDPLGSVLQRDRSAAGTSSNATSKAPGKAAARSAAMPRVPQAWVGCEVVAVERAAAGSGLPGRVVLDLGSRDAMQPGLVGELLEGGAVVATFEIVEVEEQRSRARLDGDPDAITSGTQARVRVPLP